MNLAPPTKPWESPDLFSARPDQPEYGYVANRQRHGCTRDELIHACRLNRPHVDLVWTPHAPRLVPPAEVPWLLDAVRDRTRRALRYNIKNGLGLTVVWSAIAIVYALGGAPIPLLIVLVVMLGVVPLVQPAWGLWRLRRSPTYPTELAGTFRYQVWLGTRRIVATWFVAACLVVVGLAQTLAVARHVAARQNKPMTASLLLGSARDMGATAPIAGLVKDAARAGELWRLLTCELMHGHPFHFLLNFMALLAVGRLVEMHGHPVYVAAVFLFSAIVASVFSLYFAANATSVGASGGIMGLIGFLGVIGVRRRHVLPRGFLKSIGLSIALTAATGLVARDYIDNAAHAGGLVGGVMLGVVYVRRRRDETAADAPTDAAVHLAPSGLARAAGWVSVVALAIATVATAWLLLVEVQSY